MRLFRRLRAAWEAFKNPVIVEIAETMHKSFADMVTTGRGALRVERTLEGSEVKFYYQPIDSAIITANADREARNAGHNQEESDQEKGHEKESHQEASR